MKKPIHDPDPVADPMDAFIHTDSQNAFGGVGSLSLRKRVS